MTPHKHAAIIKAWADGAEIQSRDSDFGGSRWQDIEHPNWFPYTEYRIKPKTIKYRLYLDRYGCINAINSGEEPLCHFVKWVGGWQEVEV